MRYSKGKWVASYKDTWGVETTLNKIIYAHIERLYKHLTSSPYHGVPMYYVNMQGEIDGLGETWEGDVNKSDQLRLKDLEELLWVFGSKEPNIKDYDFDMVWNTSDSDIEGCTRVHIEVVGQEEHDRYTKDLKEYEERKEAGYVLFGKIYSTLYC